MEREHWILVAYASKHGSTRAIARAIGRGLKRRGLDVDVRDVADVDGLEGYRAVVLGSAVYMGKWLPIARGFVLEHREELDARPCWLFSSGPVGDPPEGDVAVDELVEQTGARGHIVFDGRLERRELSFLERTVTRFVHAADGDYRDWSAVDDWAKSIAAGLESEQPAAVS
jgi:menaquinone-dependent protoporphyrinogen oxidase